MQTKSNIVHLWYENLWKNGEWDNLEQYYAPAPENDCLMPGCTIPLDEMHELINVLRDLVSNHGVKVINTLEDGDWVGSLVRLTGLRAGTEEPVSMTWQAMMRIDGDRIVESYPTVDFVTFFEQLGLLPENAFELLLSGTVLR